MKALDGKENLTQDVSFEMCFQFIVSLSPLVKGQI